MVIEHFLSGKDKARSDINQYKAIKTFSPAITKECLLKFHYPL